MKPENVNSLDVVSMIENSSELFRINKYKSKKFVQEHIGMIIARAGFYGRENSKGEVIAIDNNIVDFNESENITIRIEGGVVLRKAPSNPGGITYSGKGWLEVNGSVIYDGRGGSSITTEMLIVDAVNGDDTTGEKGSFSKAFKTIDGAEQVAVAGDTIRVITNITECGMGKDGLIYVFDRGVKLDYPNVLPTPAGLTSGHLWTDSKAGAPISIKVYGGIHEHDGNWFGNFDRGIMNLDYAGTSIQIFAEDITAKGDDSDLVICRQPNQVAEIYSSGGIITPLNGVTYTSSATNCRVVLSAAGKIELNFRGVAEYGSAGGNNTIINSQTEFRYSGHPISGLRSCFYGTPASNQTSNISVTAPIISCVEEYAGVGSTNGGFIFSWSGWKCNLQFNADVFFIKNTDEDTFGNMFGLFALNRTNSGCRLDIDWNVKTTIIGKTSNYQEAFSSINRNNAIVRFTHPSAVLVFLTDIVESRNGLYTNHCRHEISGNLKIILSSAAITAGQSAIGQVGGSNDAAITGRIITNGDFADEPNFTDDLSGLVGNAIPTIKVNDATYLTDITKYETLIDSLL